MGGNAATVVLAADDAFAPQLATAARSVLDHAHGDHSVRLCLLNMGIGPANVEKIDDTLRDPRAEVVWVTDLVERVERLPHVVTTITRATYGRLFIPEVLPDASRALYLDCDVVAKRDVADLIASDMANNTAMAVPDAEAPFVTAQSAVPWWCESGRSPSDLNFNAGVMLMDLDAFRAEKVAEAALRYLTDGRHYFAQDQEALNVVLAGRIGSLDPRWNQQSEIFREMVTVIQPYPRAEIERLQADPWIIHFCNGPKPWVFGCEHPLVDEWFAALDRTTYAGWRPSGPTRVQRLVKHGIRAARRGGRKVGLLPPVGDDD